MRKNKFYLLFTVFFVFKAYSSDWNGFNDPRLLHKSFRYQFNALPLSGTLSAEKRPWSDTYWPQVLGGIANRWQKPGQNSWTYALFTKEQLLKFTPAQINTLSPAEKFDLYMGRYDFPTVKNERLRNKKDAADWTGLCHGWTPASLNHPEPKPITVTNADGIVIPFGSSDLKAILIYNYGVLSWQPSGWIGKRCKLGLFGCPTVNAGTLHMVLANEIGLNNTGFIADVDGGREVWNQPVYAYTSRVVGSGPNGPLLQTVMYYADELDGPSFDAKLINGQVKFATKSYTYSLDLDSNGNITGGDFQQKDRPTYIWEHNRLPLNHPYYGNIKSLLVQ